VQHDDSGALTLNLLGNSTSVDPGDDDSDLASIPLTSSQKIFLAHAVFMTLAFIVILPLGVLQARLLRTFVPGTWWFTTHWILQWPFSSMLIIIGFILAVYEVDKLKTGHFNSTHKVCSGSVILASGEKR